MGQKIFIIDTNVLLHDPAAIKKFEKNEVVIPLSVLEELGSMKRAVGEKGANARYVLRYIDSLKTKNTGDFQKGVILKEGPTLKIYLDIIKEKIEDFPLPLDRQSNKTLFVAYYLQKKKENRVIFVSKDFVSRVKAEAMGIEAEDYENLKANYDIIHKGITKFNVEKKEIDLFYKDGKISSNIKDFSPNEYCILTSPEKSSAVCRFEKKSSKLEPILHIDKGIWGIKPLNVEQKCVFDLLLRDDIKLVSLLGPAGTGKTLLALSCGLYKVFDESIFSKILVSRPIMPLGKDIGYLPGTKEEKLYHWMQPIHDNLNFLCETAHGESNGDATLEWIMESNKIEMEAVTYIRGRSLPNVWMIIDEAQNLTPHEMKTIISRAGMNTKVILTGDPTQIDNPYLDQDSNGLTYVVNAFRNEAVHGHVFLDKTERSELAKIATKIM